MTLLRPLGYVEVRRGGVLSLCCRNRAALFDRSATVEARALVSVADAAALTTTSTPRLVLKHEAISTKARDEMAAAAVATR